ncbi:hypothetical protein [Luteolibacter soli]|uniref:SCP domain-containing protein n=1 Tax=Luteolibacter soli TaxID=3135280 RepID=A0ABU9AMR9_9BACT
MFASCLAASALADPVPTRGFEVDTSNRNNVVAFYQSVFQASEGYRDRINWTGNYTSTAAGAEGTTSAAFAGDVERRLNYFRALCGVPADVRVNTGFTVNIQEADTYKPDPSTTKAAAAQRSALMIARTYPNSGGLNHNPPQSNTAWTTAAWNANKNGNLALGFFGPGAVDAYVQENVVGISNWNIDVGHRRWLLCHWSTDFASGDTPGLFSGNSVRPPSNAMYVVPRAADANFNIDPLFHSYPAAGYFPVEHNSPYWSLSYHKADFSAATVTLRDAALNVLPVSVVSRRSGFGDNSIVWQVPASAAIFSVTGDTTFHVTVSGIQGENVPTVHSYDVTLFDPQRLNQSGVVTGQSSPLAAGSTYQVSGLEGVEQVEAGMFQRKAATWVEGAEDSPAPKVIAKASSTYPFLAAVAGFAKSGTKAFHLTFPTRYDPMINGVPQQSFELDREIVPGTGSALTFQYRRGLMTPATKLAVESSVDGGLTWSNLTTISGGGGTSDAAFQASSLPLPSAGSPLRVRFRFYLSDPTSSLYAHEDYPTAATGIFIDDIGVSAGDWLEPWGTVKASGLTSFAFNSTTAGTSIGSGTWWLRARAYLGGKAFPWGAAKVVTPRGQFELSGSTTPPVSGANYNFLGDPAATSYRFEVSAPGAGAWTEGAETAPPPQIIAQTSPAYTVLSTLTGFRKSGARSFRLGLATLTDPEDFFMVERDATPSATSALEFWTRRGPMAVTNRLHVELSTDGGNTWTSIWNLPGTKKADKAMTRQSVSLSAWAGTAVKFRFALRNAGGNNLKWNASKSGVWVDDITVTNPSPVLWSKETTIAAGATTVTLNEVIAGRPLVVGQTVQIRLRPMYGATAGAWGPALLVTPSALSASLTGFAAYQAYEYPSQSLAFDADSDGDGMVDGIEYAFSTDPTRPSVAADSIAITVERMEISRDLPTERADVNYNAEWSDDLTTWSSEGVDVRIEGGKIIASAPIGGPSRVMRWVVLQK